VSGLMLSSAVQTFTDPDEYAASIRASQSKLTVTACGRFAAKRTRIDLHHLWMQRFTESLPRIMHADTIAGRAIISFQTQPDATLLWNGLECPPSTITRHCESDSAFQRTTGSVCWGAMSLPLDVMASVGPTIAGCDLMPPENKLILNPPPSAMATLLRLHAAAGDMAEHAPEVIANPEAARGLEQELVRAMVACLAPAKTRMDRLAVRRHTAIMKRFWEVVEAHLGDILHVPELCQAVGVSDQTLRQCCRAHLGMSPAKYLMLRRLSLARRALTMADAATTTVTEIATAHGFWELGRFAVAYRSRYGERPSTTLRRAPGAVRDDQAGVTDLKIPTFA